MTPTQLTIAELHEAVWNKPLKALAELWLVHPHALGQLLNKHQIPRPPNGYWTQKALGKAVKNVALPENVSPSRLIDISHLQSYKREKSRNLSATLPQPKKTIGYYPLLKGIKSSLTKPLYQYDFILTQRYNDSSVLRMDVSLEQRDRAISILHVLLSAFEERGWTVKVEKLRYEKRLMNIVAVDGVDIPFRLREKLKQTKRELSAAELINKASNRWVSHEKINVPSGVLQLYIERPTPQGIKSMFEDRDTLSLEDQLGTFVDHLKESAVYSKIIEERQKARELEWQAEQSRRQEFERSVRAEQERINTFLDMFNQWQKAQQCRQFIASISESEAFSQFNESEKAKWHEWSEAIANSLDPLKSQVLSRMISASSVSDSNSFQTALERVIKGN
ncbi:MAG: hypothetical protein NWQ54_24645 [Paraglaciecola sp.]|nr:hypothetical protein [Paraglaciecola sp.]